VHGNGTFAVLFLNLTLPVFFIDRIVSIYTSAFVSKNSKNKALCHILSKGFYKN